MVVGCLTDIIFPYLSPDLLSIYFLDLLHRARSQRTLLTAAFPELVVAASKAAESLRIANGSLLEVF